MFGLGPCSSFIMIGLVFVIIACRYVWFDVAQLPDIWCLSRLCIRAEILHVAWNAFVTYSIALMIEGQSEPKVTVQK